jgi:hypothetical protein
MKNFFQSIVLLIVSMFFLTGCVGAAVGLMQVASIGAGALSIKGLVYSTTDGSTEITFGENEIPGEKEFVLSEISKLAIWPDNEAEIAMAEKLEKSEVFNLIVTPFKVKRVLNKNDFGDKTTHLTEKEKLEVFEIVCKETRTEAILSFKELGTEGNTNFWSFKRANVKSKSKMQIYALNSHKIIYSAQAEMQRNLGGDVPNQKKLLRDAGELIADKIISLRKEQ